MKASDLPEGLRRKLGVQEERPRVRLTQDEVRGHALKALGVLSSLSRAERRRVIRQMVAVNEV